MTEMVDPCAVLREFEGARWRLIEKALSDEATLTNVGTAAAAVHVTAEFRRRFGLDDAAHARFDQVYLDSLAARLMELGEGENLGAEMATAALIAGRKP